MMEEFIKQHIGELITAIVAGFGGWFFQRKKQNAEVQSNEIENALKALQYYREVADDLGHRLTTAITELNNTREIIKELEEKIEVLTSELRKYKQLNGKIEC